MFTNTVSMDECNLFISQIEMPLVIKQETAQYAMTPYWCGSGSYCPNG